MSRNILVVTLESGAVLLESSWVMARDAAKYLIMHWTACMPYLALRIIQLKLSVVLRLRHPALKHIKDLCPS